MDTLRNALPVTETTDPYDEWQFQLCIAKMTPDGKNFLHAFLDDMFEKNDAQLVNKMESQIPKELN